jgi:hypothetical protein
MTICCEKKTEEYVFVTHLRDGCCNTHVPARLMTGFFFFLFVFDVHHHAEVSLLAKHVSATDTFRHVNIFKRKLSLLTGFIRSANNTCNNI